MTIYVIIEGRTGKNQGESIAWTDDLELANEYVDRHPECWIDVVASKLQDPCYGYSPIVAVCVDRRHCNDQVRHCH